MSLTGLTELQEIARDQLMQEQYFSPQAVVTYAFILVFGILSVVIVWACDSLWIWWMTHPRRKP